MLARSMQYSIRSWCRNYRAIALFRGLGKQLGVTLACAKFQTRGHYLKSLKTDDAPARPARLLLSWGSLALAAAESICVAAVGLSGLRVALGMTSLIAAGAGGPASGFHSNAIRIPLLILGAVGALVSLLLLWNEYRLRRNPSAAWRMRPLSASQRRWRWFQLIAAIMTLLLVAAELITHPLFHREL
jgi:hypothetical protein